MSEVIRRAKAHGQRWTLVIPRALLWFVGNNDGALLLSQIIYWSDRTDDPEGWFWKRSQDWFKELRLSAYEVRQQIRHLEAMGVIETKFKIAYSKTPVIHYRLKWIEFLEKFGKFLDEIESERSDLQESERSDLEENERTDLEESERTDLQENERTDLEENERSDLQESERSLNTKHTNTKLTTKRTAKRTGAAPSPPEEKEPEKRGRAKKHAAIEIYREVIGRYPKKGVEGLIVAAGIETEAQQQFWQEVIRRYIGCGWNPQNVVGMLEFYEQGRLPTSRKEASGGEKKEGGYRFATPEMFGLEEESEPEDGDS